MRWTTPRLRRRRSRKRSERIIAADVLRRDLYRIVSERLIARVSEERGIDAERLDLIQQAEDLGPDLARVGARLGKERRACRRRALPFVIEIGDEHDGYDHDDDDC